MGKRILSAFFRIDARSLGLFRIAMGLVLLGDLFRRWAWLRAFYSNDGVLPNHNHLFNLRDKTQVWSFLHAFSSPGENHFAFSLILLVYVCFLLGIKTRVFQALALLCLVSLGSRNILLENQGNYLAAALLFFTLFLPLGSRFSFDSLRASFVGETARDEKSADDLNDRKAATEAEILATRGPGFSPLSFAALALTLQIAIALIASAAWHFAGPWRTGEGFYYSLFVERWVSDLGARMQHAPLGLLKGFSWLMFATELVVPFLILVPVARRVLRGVSAGLLAFYGLTLGLFFSLGLYGWSLVAASLLLLSEEGWEVFEKRFSASRAHTVIYDVDCGICLWTARLAKRLDAHRHLVFQGNNDIEGLSRGKPDGTLVRVELPASVTEALVQTSVVVVNEKGEIATRSRAIAEIVRALPFGQPFAFFMRLPGISQILDVVYDRFAKKRTEFSVLVGLDACGVKTSEDTSEEEPALVEAPSALRGLRFLTGSVREIGALVLFVAVLAQAAKENPLPFSIPQGKTLSAIVTWPRMLERFDVLAPRDAEDGIFVVDGQNRKGGSVDPLTGREPAVDPAAFNARKLGQLWNDYLYRIHLKEYEPYQRALRDYLIKGGPALEGLTNDEQLSGFDAYWLRYSIAKPGVAQTGVAQTGVAPTRVEVGRDKLFTHSRGGRLAIDHLPTIKPELRRKE